MGGNERNAGGCGTGSPRLGDVRALCQGSSAGMKAAAVNITELFRAAEEENGNRFQYSMKPLGTPWGELAVTARGSSFS